MMSGRTLVVGVGSPHGDDQVGLRVAEELAQHVGSTVEIRQAASPSDMLDWLDGANQLLLCDACQTTAPLGSVWHWNWPNAEIKQPHFSGSHNLSLPTVLELADQLGRLPPRVKIWGVNIANTQPAGSLSATVAAAVPDVVRQIIQAIDHA